MARKKRRVVESRPLSLYDEIKFHALLWKSDSEFTKLDKFVKANLNELLRSVELVETMKNVEEVAKTEAKDPKNVEERKYIQVFKEKYRELTDFNYDQKVTGTTMVIVKNMVKRLLNEGSSVVEYLMWFYDEFLPENEKLCPPNIGLSLSKNIADKFFYEKKDDLRIRREDSQVQERRFALLTAAQEIFVQNADQELAKYMMDFGSNKISFKKAKEFFLEFAEKNGFDGIINNIEKIK